MNTDVTHTEVTYEAAGNAEYTDEMFAKMQERLHSPLACLGLRIGSVVMSWILGDSSLSEETEILGFVRTNDANETGRQEGVPADAFERPLKSLWSLLGEV